MAMDQNSVQKLNHRYPVLGYTWIYFIFSHLFFVATCVAQPRDLVAKKTELPDLGAGCGTGGALDEDRYV